jgi:ABC-type glycerol-3-phosphate transport system substrate-binding protein
MDMRKLFQYVLMGVGGFVFVTAIVMFASYRPSQQAEQAGLKANLTMWGWLPSQTMLPVVTSIQNVYPDLKISYREIPETDFDRRFTEALAAGQGPDLLLTDNNHMLQYRSRLETINFNQYPESAFRAEFVNASQSLMLPWGIVAFPIAIDPLVLYSNRDLLSAGYLAEPAKTWTDVLDHIKLFTKSDDNGKIDIATIPMGTFSNVEHAADILWMLAFQQGNPLATYIGEKFIPTVRGIPNAPSGAETSIARPIEFYLAFARPISEAYTWNPGFKSAQQSFLAEESVYYLGLASEYNSLRRKNPNLNIQVSMVPQISVDITAKKRTSARIYGVAMTKLSKQKQAAFTAMRTLAGPSPASALAAIGYAPARIDLVSQSQSDPRIQVIYRSSLISQSWWNPDQEELLKIVERGFQSLEAQTESTFDVISRIDSFLSRNFAGIIPPQIPGSTTDGPF